MKILLGNRTTMVGVIGGVEKVFSNMANEFIKRGYEVSVVFSDNKEGKPYFELDERVQCYNLKHLVIDGEKYDIPDKKFPLSSKILREIIRPFNKNYAREMKENFLGNLIADNLKRVLDKEKPDLIISHRALTTKYLMVDAKTNIPVVSMFHDDPEVTLSTATVQVKSSIEKCIENIILLPYGINVFKKYCPNANVTIIPNTVKQFDSIIDYNIKNTYKIIYISRISKTEKQQHILIEAFKLLYKDFSNWKIEFWGPFSDKKYADKLKQLIFKYKLCDKVKLCGATNDVESVMRNADIFCFTSIHEGFSIALTEAMSIGLPVIGIEECLAANDLIEDKKTGLLCHNNPKDIANKLQMLMSNIELRRKLGISAHAAMTKYEDKKIWDKWESIVKQILKEHKDV